MTSIEDQVAEMQRIAAELNLQIIDIISEAKSAKRPGREGFNLMLKRIERHEAEGIVCWKLNRLVRNPIDAGQVSWLLQQGIIKRIQTYSRVYLPEDNVLMMQFEFGMANQFIKDLKSDVERGMKRKIERGWYPTKPRVGYLAVNKNIRTPGGDEIICDPVRFPIVQSLWKLALTGKYSYSDLKRQGDTLGLRKKNGTTYSLNTYHALFSDPFYTGCFYWTPFNGIRTKYPGKHVPTVTQLEFENVQDLLNNRGDIRNKIHAFPYRGIIKCGECNGTITAERKNQAICTICKLKFSIITASTCPRCRTPLNEMDKPTILNIIYYHCTKKIVKTCSQGSIQKQVMEEQIFNELQTISIRKNFYDWALPIIQKKEESSDQTNLITQLKKRKAELQNRLSGYITMRADSEISKEQFDSFKNKVLIEMDNIEKRIHSSESLESRVGVELVNYLNFSFHCISLFKKGDTPEKTVVLSKLGSNLVLKDKKLIISTHNVLKRLKECEVFYNVKIGRLEPKKSIIKQGQIKAYYSTIQVLCTKLKSIRTVLKVILKKNIEMGILE